MKAIVYDAPRRWQYADVPDPVPAAGEVLLRVAAAGVCGTDVHLDAGEFGPVYPLTPGHEIAGVVTGAGPGVTGLAAGDLVVLDNMMACGHCPQCRRARPQFCVTMLALGVTDPGGFADFVVVPAGKCHPPAISSRRSPCSPSPSPASCTGSTSWPCGPAATCSSPGPGPPGSSWPSSCGPREPAG